MTLSDLLASGVTPDLATLRAVALVFGDELRDRLIAVQEEYGDPRHVPSPVATNDGRWMLCGDILTECVEGGIVWGGFSHLDSERFGEIEVVPLEQVVVQIAPE
jgi:hypothetical protein